MQQLGEAFREKREQMKLELDEVAADLEIASKQIEQVEAGDRHAFADVFDLKEFIRVYAKYLGMDADKCIDEFNEYLFDFTSKIPLKALEIAKKEKKQKKEEIKSPYTKTRLKFQPILVIGGILLVILIGLLITYLILYVLNTDMLNNLNP